MPQMDEKGCEMILLVLWQAFQLGFNLFEAHSRTIAVEVVRARGHASRNLIGKPASLRIVDTTFFLTGIDYGQN
jgi:hypothetical protein